jgi:O-antigen ligase
LLGTLLFALPFEPRHAILEIGLDAGFRLTGLEALAGVLGVLLLVQAFPGLRTLVRRPSLPVVALALYAAAHVFSAAMVPNHRSLAVKFAARMVVMASFATVVAAVSARAHRTGLRSLAAVGVVLALLALGESAGLRALDPFLDLFRDSPFNVGGARRATAGSEYPNLAAAFLMCGLIAGIAEVAERGGSSGKLALRSAGWAALFCLGLLATYSRGALFAAGIGLGALALALRNRRSGAGPLPAWVALAVLVGGAGVLSFGGEAFRLRLATEGIDTWYGARYEPTERQLWLRPAEMRITGVRVTNTGRRTWARDEAFHLSYHWFDSEGRRLMDGGRTHLPRDVAPGESVDLDAEVRAPGANGRYHLAWDMVHERTTWFSEQGVAPANVTVDVMPTSGEGIAPPSSRERPEAGPPGIFRPGREELWRLALGMWRDHPLAGVGPDNFRWLYGPRAGRTFWDARVFANNTLLEAAATTGTLGLLALGATLVLTPLIAFRSLGQAPAPALFALAVALAAHGVVDYTLAFTGHYLLFGFVVGAVSRLAPGSSSAGHDV